MDTTGKARRVVKPPPYEEYRLPTVHADGLKSSWWLTKRRGHARDRAWADPPVVRGHVQCDRQRLGRSGGHRM